MQQFHCSQFDANFTKQTPVDSPCGASLSESVNLVFQVLALCCVFRFSVLLLLSSLPSKDYLLCFLGLYLRRSLSAGLNVRHAAIFRVPAAKCSKTKSWFPSEGSIWVLADGRGPGGPIVLEIWIDRQCYLCRELGPAVWGEPFQREVWLFREGLASQAVRGSPPSILL